LVPDVIEYSHFAYTKAELRFAHAPKLLDAALASLLRFVAQVRFERVPDFGTQPCWQCPQAFNSLRSQDDLESHSGYNIARTRLPNKVPQRTGHRHAKSVRGSLGIVGGDSAALEGAVPGS